MKLKPQTTVIFSIIFVLAGILGSWALGWWQTESDKTPQLLEVAGETGDVAAYDPADIRGSYTLGEISTLFQIPLEDLAGAFAIQTGDAAAFKVKGLEALFPKESEIGTASMRLFVAWYKGLPFERKEESFLPAPAADLLREKAVLTPEQEEYLASHTYTAME